MNQPNNTENLVESMNKIKMDTSLFESAMAKSTSALSPSAIARNNSSSLQLRAEKELNFDVFTKVIGLEIWGKPVTLLLSQWPRLNAIEKYLPENELLSIPKQLALITISTAYDELLTELSNVLSTDINIKQYLAFDDKVFTEHKALYHSNSLPFTISLDDGFVEACLLVDERTMEQFVPYLGQVSSSNMISLHQVLSPLYLEYGRSYLTQEEVSSIEVGDILMMDTAINDNNNQLRLRFSSSQTFLAEKDLESASYKIIEVLSEVVSSQKSSVQLSFDLGKATITLDELEKVGLGYNLDLSTTYQKELIIRYNNQQVGSGELIKVSTRVGLRITHLAIT